MCVIQLSSRGVWRASVNESEYDSESRAGGRACACAPLLLTLLTA